MNRIFKVLWNAATGTFVVTSETAKSRGKKNGRRKLAVSALIGLSSIMVSADALANAGNDTGDGVTPTGTQTGGKGWIAIGTDATANTYTNVDGASAAMGYKASAMGKWSTAIGSYSQSTGDSSLALGVKSVSAGDRAIAMGASSSASGSYSMAMGVYANSSGAKSVALGYKSVASGATSSALGYQATASGDDSAAFGNGAKAIGTNSVALGSGSVAQEDNSVAVGNSTTQRQITYVAKGDINSTSTDAVTGAQIYSLSQSVADRLGGGASVNSDGTVNAPLYEVGTGIYNNVGSALSALNTSITNTEASVAGLAEDALLWDESISAFSASHTGNASKITNLAAGTLAADSTDAVNGSQLFDTNEKVDKNTADIATNTDSINQNTTDIAANTTSINQNTTDIATNTTNINNLSDSITTLTDDALLWDAASGAFSAKHNGSDSKITNLAAGTLAADSTDAVNGSQLFATNENVSQNTADITTNTNSINQNTTDIATNTTNINNLSDSITTLTDDALLWDAASGTFSASRSGSASKITNLAAGTLAADSTDAVNGSQLYETNQRVDQNTSAIADINTSITNLSSDNLSWNETTSSFSASHGSSTTNKITNVAAGELSEESTDAVNGSQLFETNEKVDQNTTDIAANTTNITQNSTAIENLNTSVSDINTSITGLTDNALLWDEDIGAFSANHGGSTSKITNVAAGALSEDSTDAVNGSQLYETNQKVDQNTSAIADINTSITNLGTDALSWDDEEGAFSASHGTSGTNKITNVAAGEIASDSTDAVNGSQLYETNMLISQYSESISQLAGDTSETYITENGTGVKYIRTNDNGLEGQDAYATGNGATAVGYDAVASGAGSLALGQNSSSSIEGSIALGSGSTSNRAITTGIRETSATSDGVVIGYNTTDRELLGALSLGTDGESYRQITNVADGSEAQDAVTVRQLQNAIGAVTTTPTKYYHANSTEEDSLAVGTDSLAMGAKTIVNADAGIGIGLNTLVMADAINGIAIGSNARANHANSIAMGNGSQTTRGAQTDYTAYNMDTPQNSVGEFSVGSEDGQRQITNVAAGSADTDAVNVSQLKVTDAQVSRNTQSITNLNTQVSNLDTRVTNIENGIGDIVTTGSTKYFKTNTDGADANAQGADSVAIGSGSIAAAENSVALGTNSVADEANTVSVGSSTQQRRITNVAAGVNNTDAVNVAQLKASEAGSVRYETNADGSVNYSVLNLGDGSGGTTRIGNVSAAVNDTDAVNYAQLKRSVEEANTYTDQKMGEMNSKIKGVENKMSGGIASAMAMAGLPQAYAPGANMTSIAGGTFNGESAVAIGVSMVSESGGWVYKLQGTSNSQGDYSAAIGAGFQW
ncbi:TPA: trimeric autotransporter adhesin SadA [Salmonella enterica subsp. enterica serovar Enteritidis]|uniref:Autotransporter adhesin SadA n=1 Tax=Salmonella enterica TaxID=28901 RepID=A0A742ZHF5_SALER|nr:trimeric autotransporter adhesin SadA [Salmonella enterica]EAA9292960.1 autotransporter adhesin SadA [Salmonella enterica subsp. enterica serovar Enteritidis]EBW6248748.1 autotransporter adhesin SadA [Salmonella enterica subsp. enterica serovar Enteritidis]ECS7803167.1 autotransporter adhesin SadA [Salmonella enterica subsp. enterica serovar Enteritidis]ECT9816320.1 autotransporter adhesin SadA [Salmonella enterica subsp. enterica serovar Enteritidis]ECX2355922.1 autotransporter adhesin Sad